MRKVFRRASCDFGHGWQRLVDPGEPERPEDVVGPGGHDAVTLGDAVRADVVDIVFESATEQAFETEVWPERYYLVLRDRDDMELARSEKHYAWNAIVELAAHYRGRPPADAVRIWTRMKP